MHDIFEKIVAREIPASIVYEDEQVLAFLDIRPLNKGHVLIVPKVKFVNIFDADEEVLGHMMKVAAKIAPAIKKATNAHGATVVMNNGETVGQEVLHAHLHVIPRFENDEKLHVQHREEYTDGEEAEMVEKIQSAIV